VNLSEAKQVLTRTHIAALSRGERAASYVLESPPGAGKSDGAFQYCVDLAHNINQPVGLVQFMLTTITSPDVRGFMLPLKPEPGKPLVTVFSTPPWYPAGINMYVVTPAGEWFMPGSWRGDVPEVGVVFLDEWGQAEEEVKKPGAELLLHGNVGNCRLPVGWRVIAAQNRMSDRSGVTREMMFIVNRRGLLPVRPMLEPWLGWATSLPTGKMPHGMTISFARAHAGLVFTDKVPDTPDPFCTPRSLCIMDSELRALADEEHPDQMPMDSIAREVCAGWIGDGTAAQYFTHLRYADQLPEIADIEASPERAKLPPNRDAQMVIAYMLAHHVTEDNARNIMRYILRLVGEMQIVAVDTITADPDRARVLLPLREYDRWIELNKDKLISSRS
jgi:hypothetical protein